VVAQKAKSASLSKHVKMMTSLLKEAAKEIKETNKKLQSATEDGQKYKHQAEEREQLIEKLEQMRLQDQDAKAKSGTLAAEADAEAAAAAAGDGEA